MFGGDRSQVDFKSPHFYRVMASTDAQLRQTFRYPTESESSDASREELDEEGKHLAQPQMLTRRSRSFYYKKFCILPSDGMLSSTCLTSNGLVLRPLPFCQNVETLAERQDAKKYPLSSSYPNTAATVMSLLAKN
jgi:hypothetical protein